MTPAQRVKLIQDRMLEIGKPKNHCFGHPFFGGGATSSHVKDWVIVTLDSQKYSRIYPRTKSFKTVWEEWIKT